MTQDSPLIGIILSIVDERGPHPRIWYPKNFGSIAQIHNSAVKSFSIMIGDKTYREKPPSDLTCFGILPYPDINAIGFIHFTGFEDVREVHPLPRERPATITLLFKESYLNEICKRSPRLHQFLESRTHDLWSALREAKLTPDHLSNLYEQLVTFLANP